MPVHLLSEFTYKRSRLSTMLGDKNAQDGKMTPGELTAWVVDQLRVCDHKDTRALLDQTQKVKHLIHSKVYYQKGLMKIPTIIFERAHHTYALALYIFGTHKENEGCEQCSKVTSKGPCHVCVTPTGGQTSEACLNCFYSGHGIDCSYRKKAERKAWYDDLMEQGELAGFEEEHAELATIKDLEKWRDRINREILNRKSEANLQ